MAYMTNCCCGCMTVRTGTKVVAILSLDQRHLLLPYLVFEGLLAVVQGVVVIIVLVAIIASIYFLMVVVSFYKQLAFISQNPGQIERILPDFECHTSGCKLPWPNYKPAVNVKGRSLGQVARRWMDDGWLTL
ncbi:hypothetical protein HPB51_027831 [Rhipicephalus microplus]|uniref:Uncharacterized protein n=1 Tax=Rhipicephalus microplus TaxID=6941 RepID=A0A9J6CZD4_RHIMP|nr:hypothetical protein HPB51_027831 [Rhipicephalus microplus]